MLPHRRASFALGMLAALVVAPSPLTAGLLTARAYQRKRGQDRRKVIIPDLAALEAEVKGEE